MKLSDRQKLGLLILVALLGAIVAWWMIVRDDDVGACGASTTVTGYSSPIKARFFENLEVQRVLCEKFDLATDIQPMDTGAILCDPPLDDVDVLWIGDQSQIPSYEACRNRSDFNRNLLLSPLVIYSWASITDALIAEEVVVQDDDGVYRANMLALLELIESDQSWSDLGFENRPSKIIVQPTDPNASTSGQMFAGLLANTMNCLDVVDDTTVDAVSPGVHEYFANVGFMQTASAELFRLYMSQGEGSYPLVSLLESQIIETVAEDPEIVEQVQDVLRILYPEPTVWLTHPMIGISEEGEDLINAMLDPEIQALAWPSMGFRPTVPGVRIDLSVVPISGVQESITSTVNLPGNAVMSQILDAAGLDYVPDPNAPDAPDCSAM